MALHKKLHTSWIFKSCKFGTFRHVNSVALELYNKSTSNICYSRWDRRHFVPDIHLMTSRKLPVSTMWSSPHGRGASVHQLWCKDLYPTWSYWHFPEIQHGGRRHLGFSSYVNLAYTDVLIVWCLSSVPN